MDKKLAYLQDFNSNFNIEDIAGKISLSENADGGHIVLDEDFNNWIYIDHTHNVIKFTFVSWLDNDFTDITEVKIGLTGNFMEDINFGIFQLFNETNLVNY